MSIIGFILLGLFAGAIAKAILPGQQPGGIIGTALVGMVGALIGGILASAAGLGGLRGFFDLQTWLVSIGGAVLLLVIWGAIAGRGRRGVRA